MLMVLQSILVAADLAVQPVHQLIDGGVQVFVSILHKNVLALDVQVDFSLLTTILFLLLFNNIISFYLKIK